MSRIVMPGEIIPEIVQENNKKIILGPGLRKSNENAIATKAGFFNCKNNMTFWVNNRQKRYIPIAGDNVIGVITAKAGDVYRVDIDGHEWASLSYLSFENSTKKNRPDVAIGDAIYARLVLASKDLEPELVCVNSKGKKGKLGVLSDGFIFKTSINFAREILKENHPLINALKKELPFEIAVGMNGRIWIKSRDIQETLAIGNAIVAAENKTNDDIKSICENIRNILLNFS